MKKEIIETWITTNALLTAFFITLVPVSLFAVGFFMDMLITLCWLIILIIYWVYFPTYHKRIKEKYGDPDKKRPSAKEIIKKYRTGGF